VRSLLFVPGDSDRKLEKAFRAGADAVIVDLEDSVAPEMKDAARRSALTFLKAHRDAAERPLLYVRVNALSTPHADGDLDVVMTGAPDGIMLPKAAGGADVTLLSAKLSVREALHGIGDGATKIVVLATETAQSIFTLGTYRGASPRLAGLTWGAEDLGAATGALQTREGAEWTEPNRIVRSLALFAATAAGVPAIDAVHADFRDLEGLKRECAAARRDGFSGKLAIHPDQVEAINEAFTPSAEAIAHAERVLAAFKAAGDTAVTSLDGKMLDLPHLKAAERLLAKAAPSAPPEKPAAGAAASDSKAPEAATQGRAPPTSP
jgi:citrate lyase subunit beta / citryl-CoA lyase